MIQGLQTGFAGAIRFSIRGKVLKPIVHTKGWWIFKETFRGIRIELNAEQLKLSEKKYGKINNIDGREASIEGTIDVFLSDDKIEYASFPAGTEVGVTFAKSGLVEQFFRGAETIMIVDMVKIEDCTKLEKEILPVQLALL
jgi:hypothetical protein